MASSLQKMLEQALSKAMFQAGTAVAGPSPEMRQFQQNQYRAQQGTMYPAFTYNQLEGQFARPGNEAYSSNFDAAYQHLIKVGQQMWPGANGFKFDKKTKSFKPTYDPSSHPRRSTPYSIFPRQVA